MADLAATDEPPMPDLTGRTLGDFRLLRKIGEGGMGQVYLARQLSLKREVALKILRRDLADTATAHKRFQAEAEAVARISHPNITQVYAVGEADGLRFMALEYVYGRNLRHYLDRKGPPDLPVALAIMKQVAAALQKAGELGIVHRDIKPENILLTRKVEVKVTDFGLSRYLAGQEKPLSLTQSGMTLGTPLYMSPEQVQGKAVDHRSDLYSFGVTCYHLLAGFPPFTGATAFEVAAKHVQDEPESLAAVRPDLPPELAAVVERLMRKKPADRYPTARDVFRELTRIQKGERTTPSPTGARPLPSSSLGPMKLEVSLSGTSVDEVSVAPASGKAAPPPANRRPWRIAGAVGLLALGVLGWFGSRWTHPAGSAPASSAVVGLPDVRPPAPLTTARERQLRATLAVTPLGPPQALAALDLGLSCLSEQRLNDAEKAFARLEAMPPGAAALPIPPAALARFGFGLVLSHRDRPQESNAALLAAIDLLPKAKASRPAVDQFFFEHPAFAQAVSSAVARNADTLDALGRKMPNGLDWLRSPSGVLSRPR